MEVQNFIIFFVKNFLGITIIIEIIIIIFLITEIEIEIIIIIVDHILFLEIIGAGCGAAPRGINNRYTNNYRNYNNYNNYNYNNNRNHSHYYRHNRNNNRGNYRDNNRNNTRDNIIVESIANHILNMIDNRELDLNQIINKTLINNTSNNNNNHNNNNPINNNNYEINNNHFLIDLINDLNEENELGNSLFINNNIDFDRDPDDDEDYDSLSQKGIDTEMINRFPKNKIDDIKKLKDKNCVICLEDFKNGDETTTVPCFHIFHPICINKWFENHNKCPICNTEFKDEE